MWNKNTCKVKKSSKNACLIMVQTCLLRWCRRNTQEKGAEHWHILCIIYEDINLLSINKSTQRVLVSLTGLSLMLQKKEDTPSSKYPRGWIRDLKTVLSWHTSAHTLPQITYLRPNSYHCSCTWINFQNNVLNIPR